MDIKNLGLSLVAVVIAISALLHSGGSNPFKTSNQGFGATAPTCGGSVSCLLGDFYASGAITGNTLAAISTVSLGGLVTLDGGALRSYANATTTMTTAETLVPADVLAYDTVILNPNASGNTTLTLFASSTATTWLTAAGDSQTTCFINGTTTAGATYTFAGGTGSTLLVASSSVSAVGAKTIYPQKEACITFTRGNATATTFDIISLFTAFN